MSEISLSQSQRVLVTGATGYIGGRLVPRLLNDGLHVRVLVRDPARLQGRAWLSQVEVVRGDALQPDTLGPALAGIKTAYYLIHSMRDSMDYHQRDLIAAGNFGNEAKAQHLQRIIYLGGLGDPDSDLSEHLRSRQQTGEMLRDSGVPVTEFRAGIIVGSGSVSFEIIRYLTERMPLVICPKSIITCIQPIAVRNTLNYLLAALQASESIGQIIEIGGPDILTYRDMMLIYARVRELRRKVVPVPFLNPRQSSHWAHWMTPVPLEMARPLFEGIRNEVVVRDDRAQRLFPGIELLSYETAVRLALERLQASEVETSWSDALVSSQGDTRPVILTTYEGMMIEQRQRVVNASPATTFQVITGLGGKRGWPYFNWAWRLRGIIDWMIGGVGLRRGRRHPDKLRMGDAIDFWRVEAIEPDRFLRLRAEMTVPGLAWLQYKVEPLDGEEFQTRLVQTAFFAPKGLFGFFYWYALYPIHGLIFSGTIRKLAQRAERLEAK